MSTLRQPIGAPLILYFGRKKPMEGDSINFVVY